MGHTKTAKHALGALTLRLKISDKMYSDVFSQNFGCFYRNFGQLKNYTFSVYICLFHVKMSDISLSCISLRVLGQKCPQMIIDEDEGLRRFCLLLLVAYFFAAYDHCEGAAF